MMTDTRGLDPAHAIVLQFNDVYHDLINGDNRCEPDYYELSSIQETIRAVTEVLISHEEDISILYNIKHIRNQVRELIRYRDKLIQEQEELDEEWES